MQTQFATRINTGSQIRSWVVNGKRWFKHRKGSLIPPPPPSLDLDGGDASTTVFSRTINNQFASTTSFTSTYDGGDAGLPPPPPPF